VEVAGGKVLKVADKNVRDFGAFQVGNIACLRWSQDDAVAITGR
jgi:hypothetical protein